MNNESHAGEPPVVRLRGLGKTFLTEKVETRALSDISLEIWRGEYLVIQGPSGCGKSTLLSIMGLLEQPTSGEYLLQGADTRHLGLTRRARLRNQELGFVFQSFNLIGDLTVLENVELPLRDRKGTGRRTAVERAEKAKALLEEVGIGHRADHYPAQLSGWRLRCECHYPVAGFRSSLDAGSDGPSAPPVFQSTAITLSSTTAIFPTEAVDVDANQKEVHGRS